MARGGYTRDSPSGEVAEGRHKNDDFSVDAAPARGDRSLLVAVACMRQRCAHAPDMARQ